MKRTDPQGYPVGRFIIYRRCMLYSNTEHLLEEIDESFVFFLLLSIR